MGGTRRKLNKTEVERAKPGWLWDSDGGPLSVEPQAYGGLGASDPPGRFFLRYVVVSH